MNAEEAAAHGLLLGFSDQSAFNHAFVCWTGMSPGAYEGTLEVPGVARPTGDLSPRRQVHMRGERHTSRERFPSMDVLQPLALSYVARARALSTAEVTVRALPGGGLEQCIAHAPLPGVSREMLFWWMHHIGDVVEWEGHRVMAYRLWHPRDHISWSCDGPVRAGCQFRIAEAFQANKRFLVDNVFDVPKLGPSGFRIETRFFGVASLSIDEAWEDVPGGVRWTNTMRLVPRHPSLGPLVRVGRAVKSPMLTAWRTHNVEEVGFIPEFLPRLFAGLGGR